MPNYLADEEEELEDEAPEGLRRAYVPNSFGETNVNDRGIGDIPTVSTPPRGMDQLAEPEYDEEDEEGPGPVGSAAIAPTAGEFDEDYPEGYGSSPAKSPEHPTGPPGLFDYGPLKSAIAGAPIPKDPKWWQRLAAGAAGGLAGWSNAASRTRNPIDIGKVDENILYPGFAQKAAQYQARVQPLEHLADIGRQENSAWWNNEKLKSDSAYKAAEAERAKKQGDWYERRQNAGQATVPVTPEMQEVSHGIFKVGTQVPASTATALANNAAGRYEKPDKTTNVTDPELAKLMGRQVGEDVPEKLYEDTVKDRNRQPTAWVSYLKANDNDPKKALAAQQRDKMALRPPTEPTTYQTGPGGEPDEYLKGIANYSIQPPTPRSSSPKSVAEYRNLINAVRQINPKWDSKIYPSAQKTLNEFQSGKTSQQIDAINQVAGHLGILNTAADALKNNDINVLNRVANSIGVQTGNDAVTTYNTIVHRVSPELGRVYGTATEGENKLAGGDFDSSRGPTQIKNAIGVTANLVREKIGALQNRYEHAIPGGKFELISPEALNTFSTLGHTAPGAAHSSGESGGGKPMVQHSPSTGKYRYSTDGGKTWQPGQPQQ